MSDREKDQSTGNTEEMFQENLSYEEAYARLGEVLEMLEAGDLPLDESLALYELGAALAAYCERKLDAAELRVRQWQPQGEPTPFEAWQDDE